MQNIKIYVKKAIRKTWKRMPVIILTALVIGFTAAGVIATADHISQAYYDHAIAPLVGQSSFTK